MHLVRAQRIDRDREPACVEACRAAGYDAMLFGDLNDPKSRVRAAQEEPRCYGVLALGEKSKSLCQIPVRFQTM